ncbi:MAG TPA: T9SS type A sorting domain-containing protein [Bacteroidales bacterium]|nr:T9SS type A sorting domain-containing protein [Bacteroidales bacterium]HPS16909.1 T9SS type A sorting domain-containing protein [Bacteroidales bacterium]
MIKKILLTFALIISGTFLLNAQAPCTPDISYTTPGAYPDTITNIPHAQVAVPYSTSITVVVPADTVTTYGTIAIDSVNFSSILGLPATFTATPDKTGWPGGSNGCVLITGTPTDTMEGKTYKLTINTTIHAMYGMYTVPYPFSGYKLVVDSSSGFAVLNTNKFAMEQNSPNPFSKNTSVTFTSPNNGKYSFTILNVIGEKVFEKTIDASTGENKIEFSSNGLPSGIYLYKLSNNTTTLTKRMIIEK